MRKTLLFLCLLLVGRQVACAAPLPLAEIPVRGHEVLLSWSPCGTKLAYSADNGTWCWDAGTRRTRRVSRLYGEPGFRPGGHWLSISGGGSTELVNCANGTSRLLDWRVCDWRRDGNAFLTRDGYFNLCEVQYPSMKRRTFSFRGLKQAGDGSVLLARYSPDGKEILVGFTWSHVTVDVLCRINASGAGTHFSNLQHPGFAALHFPPVRSEGVLCRWEHADSQCYAEWSDCGKWIVGDVYCRYSSGRKGGSSAEVVEGVFEVVLYDRDFTPVRYIGRGQNARFLRANQGVCFISGNDLMLVDARFRKTSIVRARKGWELVDICVGPRNRIACVLKRDAVKGCIVVVDAKGGLGGAPFMAPAHVRSCDS